MRNKVNFFVITLVLITIRTLLASEFISGTRYQEFIGARPMAMGETFVAIADDINAIYWNPAGLPAINHLGLNSMHANLFNSGINSNYLAVSIPGFPKTSFGVDWMNIGFNDKELEFGNNKFNFSAGYQLFDWISFGANLKYIRMNMGLDKRSEGTYHGFGADMGVLCLPIPKLKLGLVVCDFTNTKLNKLRGSIYKPSLRFGAAYQLLNNLLIASDLDDRLHLGAEYWPFNNILASRTGALLALRAGLQQDIYTDEKITLSFGMGLDILLKEKIPFFDRLRFDYAFTDTPTLSNTHRFSISFMLDLFRDLVKIREVEFKTVYASLYKYFFDNPIGYIDIENTGKNALNCKINIAIDKYGEESTKTVILPAQSVKKNIPLNIVFNKSILYELDKDKLTAKIKISYMSENRPKKEQESYNIELFPRNSINWQDNVTQAAAFITPDDPLVKQFVRKVLPDNEFIKKNFFITKEMTKAHLIFNALSKYGLEYKEDPYPVFAGPIRAFDNIKYPAQLLSEKRGDCDDLTVLLASLFEFCNIPTAMVDVPGHIFMVFKLDMLPTYAHHQLCCTKDQYYVLKEDVWIPLEITWIDSSFEKAWEKGAEELKQVEQNQIIPVRDAWKKYQPTNYASTFTISAHKFVLTGKGINNRNQKLLDKLEKLVAQYPDSIKLRNDLALKYAFQNQLENAENHFRVILTKYPDNYLALNNIGNLFFSKGLLDSAYNYYEKALKNASGKYKEGVYLNIGLYYSATGDDSLAVKMFSEVIKDSTDYQKIGKLLGINIQKEDLTRGNEFKQHKTISQNTVKKLTNDAMQTTNVTKKTQKPPKKDRKKDRNKDKNKDKKKTKNSARKGKNKLPVEDVENVFFWAE